MQGILEGKSYPIKSVFIFILFHFSSFCVHNLFTMSPDLLIVSVSQSSSSDKVLTAIFLHKTLFLHRF